MKNTVSQNLNTIKSIEKNNHSVKKLIQAIVASSAICLSGCQNDGKNNENPQKDFWACELLFDNSKPSPIEAKKSHNEIMQSCQNLNSEEIRSILLHNISSLETDFQNSLQMKETIDGIDKNNSADMFENVVGRIETIHQKAQFISLKDTIRKEKAVFYNLLQQLDRDEQTNALVHMYDLVLHNYGISFVNKSDFMNNYSKQLDVFTQFFIEELIPAGNDGVEFPTSIIENISLHPYFMKNWKDTIQNNKKLNDAMVSFLIKSNRFDEVTKFAHIFSLPEEYETQEFLYSIIAPEIFRPENAVKFDDIVSLFHYSYEGEELLNDSEFIEKAFQEASFAISDETGP